MAYFSTISFARGGLLLNYQKHSQPVPWRRTVERYTIDGLSASPFVVEELEAVARWHGLSALPRTENWSLLVLLPEDHSLLPKQGLAQWLRFRWG